MCLIFIKPKTAKNYLTHERFVNAMTNNPHACGIVFRDNDGIKIQRYVKPESNKEEIWNLIKDKEEFAIHFRYATHGILNLTNTHPFVVTKGLCMMHNGVMSEFGDLNKDWSDTKNFVEYFLKPYVEKEGIDVVKTEDFKKDLEKVIGPSNKLLFIDKDFNFTIVNEKAGVWKEGCWLSNSYSVEPPYSTYYTTYAPKDGTAGKTNKYDDYMYDYDYDYGYSYKDTPMEYAAGSMTIDEVNEFIAKEVEVGYMTGDSVPYELELDDVFRMAATDEEYHAGMKTIADSIRKGVYKGSLPCQWELIVDKEDIDYLTSGTMKESKENKPSN